MQVGTKPASCLLDVFVCSTTAVRAEKLSSTSNFLQCPQRWLKHSSWKGFQGPWKSWRYLNGAGLLGWTAESLGCCKPTENWRAFFADCSRLSDPGSLPHGFKPQLNSKIHLDVLTKLAVQKSQVLGRLSYSALEVSSLQQDVLGKTSGAQWVLKTYPAPHPKFYGKTGLRLIKFQPAL